MAAPLVRKRYISAAYDDKYFPERNAAVPFQWETTPGRRKSHDGDGDGQAVGAIKQTSHELIVKPCSEGIYPLPPPPSLCRLRVKDLLQRGHGHGRPRSCLHCHGAARHHDRCPLRALHSHSLPWLFSRLLPVKASTVVPLNKTAHSGMEPQPQLPPCSLRKRQPSPRLLPNPLAHSQGRSHSFRQAPLISDRAPGRRCSSFNSLSGPHHTILEDDEDDDGAHVTALAAAAMWAGACILAAAAAEGHHHLLHGDDACKVAIKLKDLMQQSTDFSELRLPLPLALRCDSTLSPTKKRTKSMEDEAFLKDGSQKPGLPDNYEAEDYELAQKPTSTTGYSSDPEPSHDKLMKKKGFFKVLKNDCIACWCPSI